MNPRFLAFVSTVVLGVTAGCSSNSLYFGTETSSGLKVSGTQAAPTDVGLSYQRSEVALIPPKTDGSTHAVYGGVDHDFSWSDGFLLTQTFATGDAAVLAAHNQAAPAPAAPKAGNNQNRKLFFSTGTTFGFDLNLGADIGSSVPSLVLGFRRVEATVIPIKDPSMEVNSVYADISIAGDSGGRLKTNGGKDTGTRRQDIGPDRLPASPNGVRIRQTFATGDAAIAIAGRQEFQQRLDAAAGVASKSAAVSVLTRDQACAKLATITDPAQQTALLKQVNAIAAPSGMGPAGTWNDVSGLVLNFNAAQLGQLQPSLAASKP